MICIKSEPRLVNHMIILFCMIFLMIHSPAVDSPIANWTISEFRFHLGVHFIMIMKNHLKP